MIIGRISLNGYKLGPSPIVFIKKIEEKNKFNNKLVNIL